MATARPQSYVALALASLALALAMWWALATFSEVELDEDAERHGASYLPSDEWPPSDAPDESEPPSASPAALLEARQPRSMPPSRPVLPEIVGMGREPVRSAPSRVDPTVEEAPEPEPTPGTDLRMPAGRSVLVGGVDRTGARATPEVEVRAGWAWIGSTERWVAGLAAQRGNDLYPGLLMEAPRHRVLVDDFLMDRFEVSDHRYWEYLGRTSSILYRTSQHPSRTLVEIAGYLVRERPRNLDLANVTARQLFHANLQALSRAFGSKLVRTKAGVVDLEKSFERVRELYLPNGLELTFYDRAPPSHWPDGRYDKKLGDRPVRGISLEEATTYAMSRGRFIPSEIQWEYAARGPSGLDWPWGPDAKGYDERVNGGTAIPRGGEPMTLPVSHLGAGASWVGCTQMLGNVSEWTTSFLNPYPDGTRLRGIPSETVLVVRGGSTRDQDSHVVRPAFRGWHRDDPDGAPAPDQRRAWTGFRTARYVEKGRSFLPTMHYRVRKERSIDPTLLEPRIYDGYEGEQVHVPRRIAGDDSQLEPAPGMKGIVLQPLRVVATRPTRPGLQTIHRANEDTTLDSVHAVLARSVGGQPVLLGLLHTDIVLPDVWAQAEPFRPGRVAIEGRLRRAVAPHGTYYLALVEGLVALLSPDLRLGWFLSNRRATTATFNVVEQNYLPGVRRKPVISMHLQRGSRLDISMLVPLHASSSLGYAAFLRLRIELEREETKLIRGAFQHGSLR